MEYRESPPSCALPVAVRPELEDNPAAVIGALAERLAMVTAPAVRVPVDRLEEVTAALLERPAAVTDELVRSDVAVMSAAVNAPVVIEPRVATPAADTVAP